MTTYGNQLTTIGTQAMNITHNIKIIHSKADIYGNVYWAFEMTDLDSQKTIRGTTAGGESNITSIRHDWNGPRTGWASNVTYSVHEMGIRDFNRHVRDWPYAGCPSGKIQEWCKAEFLKPARTNATVIFRKYKDTGRLVALFTVVEGEDQGRGNIPIFDADGHGEAGYMDMIQLTHVCPKEEYAPMQKQLEGLGYYLTIRQRRAA